MEKQFFPRWGNGYMLSVFYDMALPIFMVKVACRVAVRARYMTIMTLSSVAVSVGQMQLRVGRQWINIYRQKPVDLRFERLTFLGDALNLRDHFRHSVCSHLFPFALLECMFGKLFKMRLGCAHFLNHGFGGFATEVQPLGLNKPSKGSQKVVHRNSSYHRCDA